MTAFVVRGRTTPSNEVLTSIEQIYLVDQTPTTPVVGVGTGTLLLIGEFEDGPFNTPTEVYGEENESSTFGGFGYTYGDSLYQNPCSRIHLGEHWNGNGFLKGKYLKPNRKIICRVDTSVGDARFTLAASLKSNAAPFELTNGQTLAVTTDTGGPASSTAISAAVATKTGGVLAEPVALVGGERIGLTIDSLAEITITFQATDTTRVAVANRVNSFVGYTAMTVTGSNELETVGLVAGTSGSVTFRDIDAGTLAILSLNSTPATGTGNVADVSAVTATEAKTIIDNAALNAINAYAVISPNNEIVVYRSGSAAGTINMSAGTMATAMGFTTGTTITGNVGDADIIAAGTRIQNSGGDEWVVMRSIAIDAGTASVPSTGFYDVEVRPAIDDGSATSAIAGTVTIVVDYPSNRFVEVTNPSNLSAALSESTIDSLYSAAFDSTIAVDQISRIANFSLSARRSAAVVRAGRLNAQTASDEGNFGRVFHTRAPFGYTSSQAIADVANYRIDRVFYTHPGMRITVPEIASIGTAGGTGFTDDGVITIGSDGPLAFINSYLNPEENAGQDTGQLGFVVGLEEISGYAPTKALYTAYKAAGICAPRVNRVNNIVFQSEVTTELLPGRTTQKRRKMSDFIQDSLANLLLPESKKLMTDSREAAIDANFDNFLGGLLSLNQPDNQRIADYSITNTTSENPDLQALGISTRVTEVRLLSSNDTFLVQTEIGEGVVITREV
jgi:hypothetical protein